MLSSTEAARAFKLWKHAHAYGGAMTNTANTANEIAAIMAGYARRCNDCQFTVLEGQSCPWCIVRRQREKMLDLERQLHKMARENLKPVRWKNWKTWSTDTTLTTGEAT